MPGDPVDHFYVLVRATATLGGDAETEGDDLPITSIRVVYKLNDMARIKLNVPLGRTGDDFSMSDADSLVASTVPFTPLAVSVQLEPDPATGAAPAGKDSGFPEGEAALVFDGYVSSIEYVRDRTGSVASLQIDGFGKLAGLAGATRFVDGLFVPGQTNAASAIVSHINKAGLAVSMYNTMLARMQSIPSNVWANAIYPLLDQLAKVTDTYSGQFGSDLTGNGGGIAPQALEDLNAGTAAMGSPGLILRSLDVPGLERSMVRQLVNTVYGGWVGGRHGRNSDLYSLLIELANVFYFNIVPRIEDAGIVSVMPNQGGDPFVVLDPDEYWLMASSMRFDENFWSYPTSVALSAPWDLSEHDISTPIVSSAFGIAKVPAGSPFSTTDKQGRLVVLQAPSWALPYAPAAGLSLDQAIPDMGNLEWTGVKFSLSDADMLNAHLRSKLGNDIAAFMLHGMLFASRFRSFVGRLRLDICPGSTIQINTSPDPSSGAEGQAFFGCVNSVRIDIVDDGNGGRAATIFDVTHLRTEAEHGNSTLGENPLYKSDWNGAKLLDY